MMMMTKKLLAMAVAVGIAAGLGGCGGDDDSTVTTPATSGVPGSASASVLGLMDYIKQLVASSADTLEPVDISSVKAPASDTTEPESVN